MLNSATSATQHVHLIGRALFHSVTTTHQTNTTLYATGIRKEPVLRNGLKKQMQAPQQAGTCSTGLLSYGTANQKKKRAFLPLRHMKIHFLCICIFYIKRSHRRHAREQKYFLTNFFLKKPLHILLCRLTNSKMLEVALERIIKELAANQTENGYLGVWLPGHVFKQNAPKCPCVRCCYYYIYYFSSFFPIFRCFLPPSVPLVPSSPLPSDPS